MQQARFRKLMVVIVLLLVAGQAAAASRIACAFMTSPVQTLEQPLVAEAIDHSRHMGMAATTDDQSGSECCPDCDCIAGSCSVFAVPVYQNSTVIALSTPVEGYSDKTLNQLLSSLFRPPITR